MPRISSILEPFIVPRKLKADAIVEALCEFRFTSSDLPEIVVGRLLDFDQWRDFTKVATPASNLPAFFRRSDPNLKYQPLFEMRSRDGIRIVRIGESALSLHRIGHYGGWSEFEPNVYAGIECLFERVAAIKVERIGFRYVNALTLEKHQISGMSALNLTFTVAGESVIGDVNVSYREAPTPDHVVMTRVAVPSFVQGAISSDATVVVDVDVYTPESFGESNAKGVSAWVSSAHEIEKRAFFRLIPSQILEQLIEE